MDSLIKNMDYFVKHWAAYPRRFPSPSHLLGMGDIRGKDHRIRRSFSTCNFSFILRGRGEFIRKKKTWPVLAPCVITQWPHEPLAYGPPVPRETWDELYLIYDARAMPWFRKIGFVQENRPVWPIQNLEGVMAQVDELRASVNSRHPERIVDRVDRICERLILESLLPGVQMGPETSDEIVRNVVLQLHQRPHEAHDFEELARDHGLSASTFRRRWQQALKSTPGRYQLDLRIQKARRLLAETMLQVGEIATQSGFQDTLYFSRRFKLETSLTPSQYRRRHRIKPS